MLNSFFILTRHCQVTAPAWKLIRDLNVDPIQVKDNGADDEKDDEEKAFQCTECDFRSDCRRRFLSHYELAHVVPDNFSCEFWCAFPPWFSVSVRECNLLICWGLGYISGFHTFKPIGCPASTLSFSNFNMNLASAPSRRR